MVEMSEVFWSFFITSMIGLLLKGASLLYKSKCKTVECCCFKVVRDVEAEVRVDVATNERVEQPRYRGYDPDIDNLGRQESDPSVIMSVKPLNSQVWTDTRVVRKSDTELEVIDVPTGVAV